ncbi:MAG: response regulator transcription factor [Phycisphaerales bacterium]|nr:response regulator transcription factor [Phycisphaerales bacterium]
MSLGIILVVEDDDAIRRGLTDALSYSGYTVYDAPDGAVGLDLALSMDTDLILLDIMMPKMDGLEVLRELRKSKPAQPVIFLTARGEEHDRIGGLKLGADDYIVKPFSIDELLARVEAVLRRSPGRPTTLDALVVAGRTIDFERREVVLASGSRRTFTEREHEVLVFLSANAGRAVSRDELLQKVWGLDPRGTHTRTVDMTIARLRETLDDNPSNPEVIRTVRGKGYMLVEPESDESKSVSDGKDSS